MELNIKIVVPGIHSFIPFPVEDDDGKTGFGLGHEEKDFAILKFMVYNECAPVLIKLGRGHSKTIYSVATSEIDCWSFCFM